jgi:hypothetical protein
MPGKLILYLAVELQRYETGAALVQLSVRSTFNKAVLNVKDF